MWADTLLALQRAHLLRLATWGVLSLIAAVALMATLRFRRDRASSLLASFAMQLGAWGAMEIAVASFQRLHPAEYDFAAATQLMNLLWLFCGLDMGAIATGFALAWAGWALERRQSVTGSGLGIATQGAALLALHALFITSIQRATATL